MREWIMEQGMIFYFFCAVGVFGAAAAAAANRMYKRLIREADAMEHSEQRLIKYIKLKYSSYYTLGMKANDEKALVKRYLYRYKMGPMTLIGWSKAGLAAFGAVLAATFGNILYGLSAGVAIRNMLSAAVLGFMIASILAVQYRLYSFRDKQAVFCAQMEDNLQNFLKNKIEYGHILKEQQMKDDAAGAPNDAAEKNHISGKAMADTDREEMMESREDLRSRRKNGEKQAAATGGYQKNKAKQAEESIYAKAAIQLADGFGTEEIDARVVEDILKEFLN